SSSARNCAVVVWREWSGIVILPFQRGSKRTLRVFGSSSFLTRSVLTRMLIGLKRHGVRMPSASRNCLGNFAADGGANLSKTPSVLRMSCGPLLPSITSKPGLPARHSFNARSRMPVVDARQYSTRMPYFFSNGSLITFMVCGGTAAATATLPSFLAASISTVWAGSGGVQNRQERIAAAKKLPRCRMGKPRDRDFTQNSCATVRCQRDSAGVSLRLSTARGSYAAFDSRRRRQWFVDDRRSHRRR